MVYVNNFIAVVKCNGKIMREVNKDTIQLPFGSEYSLFFKNLNNQRVVVGVDIDGKDVMDGHKLVIDGNSECELERFIDNNDSSGNRFKFIQKTDKIINHRGDRIDDGIVRIEYAFEEKLEVMYSEPKFNYSYTDYNTSNNWAQPYYSKTYGGDTLLGSSVCFDSCSVDSVIGSNEGVTVPGSISNQSFQNTYTRTLGTSKVIIFKLQGINGSTNIKITKPLTVDLKLECETCGTKNRSNHKFCTDCGTSLM